MQWFHPAIFHNQSVFTHPLFATESGESLALSDLIPSVLPSHAGSSSPHAAPGRAEVSAAFISLGIPSHNPHCTSHRGTRANGRRIGSLRRGEAFLYSSKLTVFCGKPSLQIKAKIMLSEQCESRTEGTMHIVWAFFKGMGRKRRSKDVNLACTLCSITSKQCDNANPL